MKQSQRTVSVVLLATLLALSVVPQGAMAQSPTNVVSYGVEYDWSNLDGDLEGFTGLDFNDILGDVMDSATQAGFELIVAEITTGSSNMYVLSEEDHSAQTVNGVNGDVWSRTTELTVRHGMLADSALYTEWSETTFGSTGSTGFDIEASYDVENTFTTDALYVEYFDATSNELVGADLDLAINAGFGGEFILDAQIEGGGEIQVIDFAISANADIGLDSSHTEWRLSESSDLYSIVSTNDNTEWQCIETGSTELWYDVNDECGEMDGTYSASMNYAFDLSGIPTEEFGMSAGELDFSVSDNLANSGVFEVTDSDMAGTGLEFEMSDSLVVELGDGTTTTVRFCAECGPVNPLMTWMMAHVLESSMVDTLELFGEDIAQELEDEFSTLGPLFGDDEDWDDEETEDDSYLCDNGNLVDAWNLNDGYDDCGDGSDEGVVMTNYVWLNYDNDEDELAYGAYFTGLVDNPDFVCGSGIETYFSYVNDNWGDCSDGSDEQWFDMNTPSDTTDDCQVWSEGASCVGSEVNWYDCEDGGQVWIHQVNDGTNDCGDGSDEEIEYSVEMILTDATGTPITSNIDSISSTDTMLGYDYLNGLSAYSEVCLQISIKDSLDNTVYNEQVCQMIGMMISYLDVEDDDGLSVGVYVYLVDTYGYSGYTAQISVTEVGATAASDSVSRAIDGTQYYAEYEENLLVSSEGDYVVTVELIDDSANTYSTYTSDAINVADEPQPSQKLIDIAEAFENSNFISVMESFGQNVEQVFSDLEPNEDFPYDDGKGVFLWSNSHATVVGMGIYVHNETNGWHTLVGPTTAGMGDSPQIPVSVNYVTGQDAIDGAATATGQTTLEEIVDVSTHDTADLEQDLVDAGIDPAALGLGNNSGEQTNTPPTAEELVDEGGLLPFASPAAVLSVTILAGLVAAVRNRKEE